MSTALRLERVSKQYRIYQHPGDRLKESLTRGLWRWHREFWALRDVSFEVEAGTTIGRDRRNCLPGEAHCVKRRPMAGGRRYR